MAAIRRPRKIGSDTPRRRRQVSGAIDQAPQAVSYDAHGRIVGSSIRAVKAQHDPNWAKTRERAAECRTLLAGELPMVMPENFKLANAESFAADLPTTYTRPSALLALLLQKELDIVRYRSTGSERSNANATKLEQILDAVMKDPRLSPENNPMPFDGARMIYGGFAPVVALSK